MQSLAFTPPEALGDDQRAAGIRAQLVDRWPMADTIGWVNRF
jgi:hypothetical protein